MDGIAPIQELADEERLRAEAVAWQRFAAPRDRTEFCMAWLAVLCAQIPQASGALLLLGPDAEGVFTPAAMWPDVHRDLEYLVPAAERTLSERRGMVLGADGKSLVAPGQNAQVGYPVETGGTLHGAVVLDLAPAPDRELQRALRLLHWGSAWLVDQVRQRLLDERAARLQRSAAAMDLLATALQERRAAAAALAVVNALAGHFGCDRVSIGFERHGAVEVAAISNTAVFDPKMSLVRHIAEAMDEVLDLDSTLLHPPADDTLGAIAHAELARAFKDYAICSVPLVVDGHGIGVLTLERGTADRFTADEVELCNTIGALIGPVFDLQRDNARGTLRRIRDGAAAGLQALVGPRHPGVKLIALLVVAATACFSFATSTYRVSARAVLEGAVQRAAVAPFDGHILQSLVRAGDTVRKDQVLARLDDRDLKLERDRLVAERQQAVLKHQQALAQQDRAAMVVSDAEVAAADAQIALMDDRLARATLRAPFDGLVVSGDLSQLLGTPVEQGKMLFQVAPLNAYRVVLQVDERDIAQVAVGQAGELALSGLPGEVSQFAVQSVTPVSTPEDGRNFFRVEASLRSPPDRLRPGMEGIGKIEVGSRKLIWVLTHSLVDWLRGWMWKELP